MIPIIGGALDGSMSPVKIPQITGDGGDKYLLIQFRDKEQPGTISRVHHFYMKCDDLTVEQAQKIYRERHGASKAQ